MSDKLEAAFIVIAILFQAVWDWCARHNRFLKAVAILALALICIPRALAGGQNAVLVGWIGLISMLIFLGMVANSISGGIRFPELEPVDHKEQPDPRDWLAEL